MNQPAQSLGCLAGVIFGAFAAFAFGADEVEQMAPCEELVFVEKGKPLAVIYEGSK